MGLAELYPKMPSNSQSQVRGGRDKQVRSSSESQQTVAWGQTPLATSPRQACELGLVFIFLNG